MHNTFTTLFIYIRLHVSALYGPSSGRYKLPSLQTKMRKYLRILVHFVHMLGDYSKYNRECTE
jgi:hypothetical protein